MKEALNALPFFPILIIVITIFILGILATIIDLYLNDRGKIIPQPIMTPTESKFYDFLYETIGNQYLIETHKPLKEIFKRQGRLRKTLWTMHTNGHVDFLFVDRATKNPILGIELDDWTHNRADRQDADRRKDELFRRANLKLIRFKVTKWGETERTLIQNTLNPAIKTESHSNSPEAIQALRPSVQPKPLHARQAPRR